MDIGNQEVIYCEYDEYRVHCEICDKVCIERYNKYHLKSGTHTLISKKNNDQILQIKIFKNYCFH